MRSDLATIIGSLITNIGAVKDSYHENNTLLMSDLANKTASSIDELEHLWPNLNEEEKQELKAVSQVLRNTYTVSAKVKTKKSNTFDKQ